jgi:hypothetical protein
MPTLPFNIQRSKFPKIMATNARFGSTCKSFVKSNSSIKIILKGNLEPEDIGVKLPF